MSVFCRAAVYLLVALPAVAQSQAFARITIKPARSSNPGNWRVQVLPNGDLIARSVPVGMLLSYAYDVPINPSPRLSPLPEWTVRERYDIEAKAPADALPQGLQDSEVRSRIQQMLRGLLADRFRLVMRVENKTMSVYALTVASGGPKLQKSAIAEKDCVFDTAPDGCHNFVIGFGHPLNAKAIDMDDLVHYIENWTDLPVVNRTALSGLFTVNTEGWFPMRLPPPPPNYTPPVNHFAGLPTIFTVLGKLGLELKRQNDILPVYTVERIERRPPTDDHALLRAYALIFNNVSEWERADAITAETWQYRRSGPRPNCSWDTGNLELTAKSCDYTPLSLKSVQSAE